VSHLVGQYGYIVVVLLVGVECLGIPIPGETALLAAGALSARGELSLPFVMLAAAAGVAVGGAGGYWIGRTGGHSLVVRYGRWVGIRVQELDQSRMFFDRHGIAAVMIGRFLPVVRILTGVVAGITVMPFKRFALVNAVAGTLWAIVFGAVGFGFSRTVVHFESHHSERILALIVVASAIGFFLWKRWEKKYASLRRRRSAEQKVEQ